MKNRGTDKNKGINMIGKTKKFGLERLCAIIEYMVSLYAAGCKENLNLNRSIDFNACVILFKHLTNL